ncbi:hypothetical protein [Kitasatospora aureofaciens]|uniref:hypothetical protein n=1 Tax=Kitasatospora aureofaciens TaxID=1894 RepID=UPI0036F4637A
MTNMTLVAAESGAGDEDQEQRERGRQRAVNEVLAEAAEAGRRAAGWVRELAGRQPEERHRIVLERAADAVEGACGREVALGGEGQLDQELAYDLSASIVTGNPYAEELPELSMDERIALAAVCEAAGAAPSDAGSPRPLRGVRQRARALRAYPWGGMPDPMVTGCCTGRCGHR